ncbi:MAG: hypothetical protein JW881_21510 [Spirochaetales bacterium]|nr:hypothetical protein [Spirochaetales bacterium]
MIKADTHEFHFIIPVSMKNNLKNLSFYGSTGSMSGVVARIVSFIDPLITKEHQWGRQRMSRYKPVSSLPDEKREHIHVYFPEEIYRKIKLLHSDLNCYSMAQFLRGILRLFLWFVERYGVDVFQKFKKVFNRFKREDKDLRHDPRMNLRQLFRIIRHIPGKNRLVSIYTHDNSPFWILRL